MKIRFADSEDKDQVLTLLDEFSLLLKARETPSKIGGKIFDEIITRNDIKIFVADENGILTGLATLYLLPNIRHGWQRGHIEDFFISGKYRRKGIGSLLLNAVKDYCRKNSIRVIKLDSGNELTKAHRFYEKNGGKSTERFFRFDID